MTDSHLRILAEGPVVAIHHPDAVLERMDEWNRTTHGGSGLLERVRRSASTVRDAERLTLDFLAAYAVPGASPMCGNSICQDRRFLYTHMKSLESYFHYRNLDVSTLKELARRWAPDVLASFSKVGAHTALSDIRESVKELAHYRQHMGKLGGL